MTVLLYMTVFHMAVFYGGRSRFRGVAEPVPRVPEAPCA